MDTSKFRPGVSSTFVALLVIALLGCTNKTNQPVFSSSTSTASEATTRNLAWLGGTATPLTESIAVADPKSADKEIYPGGLIVRSIEDNGQLEKMELRKGDVIIGVGDEMLPNKEDPTLDFIRFVEGEVSAEQDQLVLTFLRDGKVQSAETSIDLAPFEQGLPLKVERYSQKASRGLQYLLEHQNEDGSFSAASGDANASLMVSSLCGLALHSADDDQACQAAAKKCLDYVISQIPDDPTLDPLTASYAIAFLIESAAPPANMKQVGNCMRAILKSQHEDGGWLTATASDPDVESETHNKAESQPDDDCDVLGTFATNQVLMALAVAERNGMLGENEPIEKAVAYLKSQAEARISSPIDRRVKAGLSAGTAAAFVALNVDRSDELLTRLSKEALARAEDIPHSRALGVPHALAAAILSRQLGVNAWIDHHRHAKLLLSQLQLSDGAFEEVANAKKMPLEFERSCNNACWRTAHYCLMMQVQRDSMAAFAAERTHPMLASRAGDGSKREAGQTGGPEGAVLGSMQFDLEGLDPSSMTPEELKEKMLEKLKEQGIDIEGADVQIMTSEAPDKE